MSGSARVQSARAGGVVSSWQAWGLAMMVPYVLVFAFLVVYPIGYGLWLARHPASYEKLAADPIFVRAAVNTLVFLIVAINVKMAAALFLSGFFTHDRIWIRWLSVIFILPWAIPSIPTILSFRFMLNPEWGVINQVWFRLTMADGPNWLNDPTLALALAMVVHVWKTLPFWNPDVDRRTLGDLRGSLRGGDGGRRVLHAEVPFRHMAVAAGALSDLHHPLDDLDGGRFQQRLPADRRRAGRPHPCPRNDRNPLPPAGPGRHVDGGHRNGAAADHPARDHHDAPACQMSISLRDRGWFRACLSEAGLLLVGIPILLWTLLPIYHMFLFALSPQGAAFEGKLWPDHPTLRNFQIVLEEKHHYLLHFWRQLWNSVLISFATGFLTLLIATTAAFAISRLRVRGGRVVMNLALFTYFIPAAFLAVPMYKTMGAYGLLNSHMSLILAMVTVTSPYAIWILKQASDNLPRELDEAAIVDGATPLQLFRLVYLPLMLPSMVAIGIYALLLAWNEYLFAFLLLSRDVDVTLPVALGSFLAADDSPWELLMATGLIYALPPAAIYYVFKRYMVGGMVAGAVKG